MPLLLNKVTGEMNAIRGDGTGYLLGMYVEPPDEADFCRPASSH